MTYLQLVQSVLRRLREDDTIQSVSENSYSRLIGEFVNDSKRIVEDSWDWSALRTTFTIDTTTDIFRYQLEGSDISLKILDIINDTSNCFLKPVTSSWMNNAFLNNPPAKGSPAYYSWNGFNDNGEAILDLYPIPDDNYFIRVNTIDKKETLVEDSAILHVPSNPVIHYAVALASRERGETGGTSSAELFAIADQTLGDMIAFDVARHPEETVWRPV
jgi:hypothetical protein|tara:strand:- start:2665 stop:3315 length:651 start_codon:yes stop_codon:yes gene_type:complete